MTLKSALAMTFCVSLLYGCLAPAEEAVTEADATSAENAPVDPESGSKTVDYAGEASEAYAGPEEYASEAYADPLSNERDVALANAEVRYPYFDLPAPQPSAQTKISLASFEASSTFGEIEQPLSGAIRRAGYEQVA